MDTTVLKYFLRQFLFCFWGGESVTDLSVSIKTGIFTNLVSDSCIMCTSVQNLPSAIHRPCPIYTRILHRHGGWSVVGVACKTRPLRNRWYPLVWQQQVEKLGSVVLFPPHAVLTVKWPGLVVRCPAGKETDPGLSPLYFAIFCRSCGLCCAHCALWLCPSQWLKNGKVTHSTAHP